MAPTEIDAIREMLGSKPRPTGWAARRQRLDEVGSIWPIADDVRLEDVDLGGLQGEWSDVPGADDSRVLLFFHGGGYCSGSIVSHRRMVTEAGRKAGCRTLAVGYRLAPEHPFPAAVEDTVAALMWLSHEAPALGLDPERIAVAGDSAGGGLAAVALHETKGRLAAPVRAQALIYPGLDLRGRLPSRKELADQFPIPRDMIDWFYGHYFGLAWPLTDPRAIPSLYEDYTGLPPALIITAGHDPLRDEGAEYAETLAAAGVPVEYKCCEGTIHGFMNMGRVLRTAHGGARQRIAVWLAERLRKA